MTWHFACCMWLGVRKAWIRYIYVLIDCWELKCLPCIIRRGRYARAMQIQMYSFDLGAFSDMRRVVTC